MLSDKKLTDITKAFKSGYALNVAEEIIVAAALDELSEYRKAKQAGTLQVIDKDLFCRKANKRDGKCAGYNENMFSHKTLEMCAKCDIYDPNCDSEDYYGDGDSDELRDEVFEVLGDLLGTPCDMGFDDYMSQRVGDWCHETCGSASDSQCWKKLIYAKWEDGRKE